MSGDKVREARRHLRLTQQQAARRWKLSQPYLSMVERNQRPAPRHLTRRLVGAGLESAVNLPLTDVRSLTPDLPRLLGTLGYSGFSYLANQRELTNPAVVLLAGLEHGSARVTEALPWLMVSFPDLDWDWLLDWVKRGNLQNRLGYLVSVASDYARTRGDLAVSERLRAVVASLEEARLAKEDTLGAPVTEAERRHYRAHRPAAAAHWNLLTAFGAHQLRYA